MKFCHQYRTLCRYWRLEIGFEGKHQWFQQLLSLWFLEIELVFCMATNQGHSGEPRGREGSCR